MADLKIHFDGPFKFGGESESLFRCHYAKESVVYIWTFKQTITGDHLIHYVGETSEFAKRHEEHLRWILSLGYGIIDPHLAQKGICKFLYSGVWRDKSADASSRQLEAYKQLQSDVIEYVELLNVFVAPCEGPSNLRRAIEGSIGTNLRVAHSEDKVLYPDDNRIWKGQKYNGRLSVTASEQIRGLDPEIYF